MTPYEKLYAWIGRQDNTEHPFHWHSRFHFTGIPDTAKKSAETNLNDYMTQIDAVSKAADMMAEQMMNGARMDATYPWIPAWETESDGWKSENLIFADNETCAIIVRNQ